MDYRPIIIAETVFSRVTTGVSRYINLWIEELMRLKYKVVYFRFEYNLDSLFVYEQIQQDYVQVSIPLPEDVLGVFANGVHLKAYFNVIYPIIKKFFSDYSVFHIHSPELYGLAELAKQDFNLSTILHLHSIPWRNLYNTNKTLFYDLHKKYTSKKKILPRDFFTVLNEEEGYKSSDEIICVTEMGRKFLKRMEVDEHKLHVIYNGLNQTNAIVTKRDYKIDTTPKAIFVGGLRESKGLDFVLQAILRVQQYGYELSLSIAGYADEEKRKSISEAYPSLSLEFLGNLPFHQLFECYNTADLGLIASLQEQCSYAAIEMMMSGLPIISTNADGLDEMFTHGKDALIVPVLETNDGIIPDVNEMVIHLVRLINDYMLRKHIGEGAKRRSAEQFSFSEMFNRTINIYNTYVSS